MYASIYKYFVSTQAILSKNHDGDRLTTRSIDLRVYNR